MSEASSPKRIVTVLLKIDPDEMARRGRIGATALHAKHDSRITSQAGRDAFLARFADAAERSMYFRDLALKSAAARRARKSAEAEGGEAA